MLKGYVDEVFVSIQGEGPLVGTPMLFVRLSGCSAACEHCDQPRARTQFSQFTIHGHKTAVIPNPIKAADLAARVLPLLKELPFLTVTGGEPLEQPGFLSLLLTRLSEAGKKVLLDTNGLYPRELAEILPRVDVVAVDIKIPSFAGWNYDVAKTKEFLTVASSRTFYVKVVVGADTPEAEVVATANLVAAVNADVPFVLQPRWDNGGPTPEEIQRLMIIALRVNKILPDVRLIPQVHRFLGVK